MKNDITWERSDNSEQNTLRQQRRARMLERLSPHGATPTLNCMASLPDVSQASSPGTFVGSQSKTSALCSLVEHPRPLARQNVITEHQPRGHPDLANPQKLSREKAGETARGAA
jgi:hypothetical protein